MFLAPAVKQGLMLGSKSRTASSLIWINQTSGSFVGTRAVSVVSHELVKNCNSTSFFGFDSFKTHGLKTEAYTVCI
jgi:hypothetical protein